MLLPAVTEAGPLLVMERSARGVTVVDCTVALFAPLPSVAPEAAPEPGSGTGPGPGAVAGVTKVAEPPLPIVPLVQVMAGVDPLQPAGKVPNALPAGPLIVNVVTEALESGPPLVMVAV